MYQQALLDRRRSAECPALADAQGLDASPVRVQLEALCALVPTDQAIAALTSPADLKDADVKIARIALLWRERSNPWAADLAAADRAGRALDDLFHVVDTSFWNALKTAAGSGLTIERAAATEEKPQTHEVVEMNLMSHSTVDTRRIRFHPLRVGWTIQSSASDIRTTETDGLTLVQYFPAKGPVTVKATLVWSGEQIPIERPLALDVVENPEYRKRGLFQTERTEYAAIGAAALFAIVTAMSTQYDSTFGSMTQYLALFVWAAGAGTGGNLFSQLGTTTAPGGASATLKTP